MAVDMPRNRYTIDSLYLDTRDFQLYQANNLELPERFKARIRSYPAAPGSKVFLEIKGRNGDIILKTRGPVSRDAWRELVERPPTKVSDPAVERFLALKMRHCLEPVVIVRYEREPWVSTLDRYARVTFDTGIRHQPMEQWCLDTDERRWRPNDAAPPARFNGPKSPTILELKFGRAVPSWLSRVVQRFDLPRRAFSKYGTAIQGIFARPMLRTARGPT